MAMAKQSYPGIIVRLPEADIAFGGVKGWIAQGATHQTVFIEAAASIEVPAHRHAAQWGIVVDGELELTIDGETHVYRKGDEYFIPSQAAHSAKFLTPSRLIDFFNEPHRYKPKPGP